MRSILSCPLTDILWYDMGIHPDKGVRICNELSQLIIYTVVIGGVLHSG